MHAVRTTSLVFVLAAIAGAAAFADAPRTGRDPRDEVFYHFMPIAWRDSDNDAHRFGDFGGMTASLDYLDELGVTAIWMNPIFPSPAYHGYQHGAADQLNAWFGTEADFVHFLQQAHARGMRVFVDYVAYGVSHNSIWFQSAYGNPSSPYDDWLAFTNPSNTQYQGYTFPTWNGSTVGFIHWNLNNANAAALVTTWAQYWLDPNGDGDFSDGVDGYRLDHVWANYPYGPNGWGYNIDDFWVPWKQALQAVNPDVFTFVEQADWGSHGVELLLAHDASMTKPFEFAARDAMANEYAAPLYSQTAATVQLVPEDKTFVAIIGDHDVDRLASVLGGSLEKAKAAAAVLMTQPFPPIVYYGDEIGMLGIKGNCGGDANDIPMREPFKWNAIAGPPMSDYWVLNACAYNGAYSHDNDGRSVEEQAGVAGSLLEEYRLLIAARHGHVALRRGDYFAVPNDRSAVWAFVRHHADQQLLVAINLAGSTQLANLDLSDFPIPGGSTTAVDVLTGQSLAAITTANQGAYPLSLAPYRYRILAVSIGPPEVQAQAIDGRNIPSDFGPPYHVATQNNATGLGDNLSELNQLFVRAIDETLHVGLTGNLQTNATGLVLLLDTQPGGQGTLDLSNQNPPPYGPRQLTGLTLDAGFVPDHMLYLNAIGSTFWVDQFALLTGGAGKIYRGSGTVNSGMGTLAGGTNPNGMQVAFDNTNTAGVTDIDASGAGTATTGFELVIPFADVGLSPSDGTFGVAVFIIRSDGEIGNQWLPGLGGGYGNLGYAPFDMAAIPGHQYATVILDRPPGDWNGDGVVDFADFAAFTGCVSGPGNPPLGPGCTYFDFDADYDVDLANFATMQAGT